MDNILEIFIKEPEKEFHVRQISKLLKKSPTTISKNLKELEEKGILKSEKRLNHLLFKANLKNEKFKLSKLNYNLNQLHNSGLIDYLVKKFNYPEAIILFGSFAKAENTLISDIDLLIITSSRKEVMLDKFEKKIGQKIQLFMHSKKEIENMKKKNKELLNNWVNGNVIYGFWELFK
ncbi:MAG: nucleotidyltransferase domain-containing protein [Nanoarchaeota archaeon]|nr:nucleotidyltransferase domain-containing protein [Nanoarchaeota archaeon]MBU4116154.1 nucleotidyltransferase domain-containing protein [Nanoarchaeota archaeon]